MPTKFTLMVKGSLARSLKAANHHLPGVLHQGGTERHTDSLLEVMFPNMSDVDATTLINKWFCLETKERVGYGYPDGTLLWWCQDKPQD